MARPGSALWAGPAPPPRSTWLSSVALLAPYTFRSTSLHDPFQPIAEHLAFASAALFLPLSDPADWSGKPGLKQHGLILVRQTRANSALQFWMQGHCLSEHACWPQHCLWVSSVELCGLQGGCQQESRGLGRLASAPCVIRCVSACHRWTRGTCHKCPPVCWTLMTLDLRLRSQCLHSFPRPTWPCLSPSAPLRPAPCPRVLATELSL